MDKEVQTNDLELYGNDLEEFEECNTVMNNKAYSLRSWYVWNSQKPNEEKHNNVHDYWDSHWKKGSWRRILQTSKLLSMIKWFRQYYL